MINQARPTVNGDECSWADIELSLNIPDGQAVDGLVDFTACKWDDKLNVGKFKGASGGRVMKTTAGSVETSGSLTVSRTGARIIREALVVAARALGQVRGDEVIIGGIRFDIVINHTPLGDTQIFTTKLEGCRYLGDTDDMKESDDPDLVEIAIDPIKVKRKHSDGSWIVLR